MHSSIYQSDTVMLNLINHFFLQNETFKKRLALSGISKESWTDENERALDEFISEPSVRVLIVYVDPFTGPRVDFAMPAQVRRRSILRCDIQRFVSQSHKDYEDYSGLERACFL